MAEHRRENSLLVSLKELKDIEEDRVKEEEQAARARVEAETRAREDVIRRAKEAEEAKIREAEEKIRRERDEKERQIREEQLRLQESERRARIEAQAKVEEARIQAEAQIRVAKAPPVRLIIGITLTVMVLSSGAIYYMYKKHQEEQEIATRESEAKLRQQKEQAEAARLILEKEQKALTDRLNDLTTRLAAATSEVDRAKIRQQMDEERRASAKRRESVGKKVKPDGTLNTSDPDPLGNLPGIN